MKKIMVILNIYFILEVLFPAPSFSKFLPDNKLYEEDNIHGFTNVSKEDFYEVLNKLEAYYRPIVNKHGAFLDIYKSWESSTVNAYAQRDDDKWIIKMFGGMARRPEITKDAFLMIGCHEIGHHLGGFPFVSDWASNEGQSDYFAFHSCAKNMWKEEKEINYEFSKIAQPIAIERCDKHYTSKDERRLCYRASVAGESLANLLSYLAKTENPSFETPSEVEVDKTIYYHPHPQCRLDTFLAASLCQTNFNVNNIPGETGSWKDAEIEAIQESCSQLIASDKYSARPRCWFKQKY